jgi:hypothetical protein
MPMMRYAVQMNSPQRTQRRAKEGEMDVVAQTAVSLPHITTHAQPGE